MSLDLLKLIHSTCRDSLEITAEPSKNLEPWNSKFGGMPYIPKDMPWPHTNDGRPLRFLAQINFAELCRIDPFPEKGLLQFYIIDNGIMNGEFDIEKALKDTKNEYVFGADPDNPTYQNLFRVIFFPDVDETRHFQTLKEAPISDHFPIREQYRLYFSRNKRPLSCSDYKYHKLINNLFDNEIAKEEEFDLIYHHLFALDAFNHRIGGYPTFVQYDPRPEYDCHHDKNILLLQIASKGSVEWIGSGVANFLISEEKLKNLDFSEVMYNIDFS